MIKGIFNTLLFLTFVFLAFRLVFRFLFPWILKKYLQYMHGKMQESQKNYQTRNTKKQGDITIHQHSDKPKTFNDDEGEYVEYEDLK